MELRQLGRSGLRVSRLGLGTLTWGRDTDEIESADQLRVFLDAGGTLVDTAAGYGDGESERVLGSLLGTAVSRDDVVLSVKAGLSRRRGQRQADTSRGGLLRDLDASLSRLGTDHLDLWQVHCWSSDVAVEETLSALDAAQATGRAHYVGVSNYNGWQTAVAATHQASWPGRALLSSNQVEYSLLQRGIEREVLPAAAALGLGILAWAPLGRGVLTGKYRTGIPADSRAASPHLGDYVATYLDARSRHVVDALVTAAAGLGCSPVEVALAWVRDQAGVTSAIVGARTAAQLRGSLTAELVRLPIEIIDALDDVSAPPQE